MYRVDATPMYPEVGAGMTEDARPHQRPLGAFIMLAHQDRLYLLHESQSNSARDKDDLLCETYPIHFRKQAPHPLVHAHFDGTTFTRSGHAGHRYSRLFPERCWKGMRGETCVTESELVVDAFDQGLVEMMVEGVVHLKKGTGKGKGKMPCPRPYEEDEDQEIFDDAVEAEEEMYPCHRFGATLLFDTFTFNPSRQTVKKELRLPETLKRLCRPVSGSDSGSLLSGSDDDEEGSGGGVYRALLEMAGIQVL